MRHTSLTFTWVKLCKRPRVKSEPTYFHFLIFVNNGKAFPSLDGMTCGYQCPDQLELLPGHWKVKRYWISYNLENPNLLENNLYNTRNNMKSQIKSKKNGSTSLRDY